MALTITRTGYNPIGSARPVRAGFGADIVMTMGQFTFDNSYTLGGLSLPASGMGLLDAMFVMLSVVPSASVATSAARGLHVEYLYSTSKVLAFGTSGGAGWADYEMPAGQDLSSFTVRFVAFGHKLK